MLTARATQAKDAIMARFQPSHESKDDEEHHEAQAIVATSPELRDVIITQQYVCQIHSQRHIEICAIDSGYLQDIRVREGQEVKKGDVMFTLLPVVYKAKLDAELAEAELARLEYNNTKRLFQDKVVSENEVKLLKAKLDRATAKAEMAQAEFNFTEVKAPFDGIVDRLHLQLGSKISEGDVLTTMSDNSVMWVYFNVPEARYLDFKARQGKSPDSSRLTLVDSQVELVLANGSKFDQSAGNTVTVEADFNNETGNIAFRADFPNPNRLLRHGQTGTILIHELVKDAMVIPQRATFEILDKRYVWVIGDDNVAHQRLITLKHELEDTFVVDRGLELKDRIVLEGVREVQDGEKVTFEFLPAKEALAQQKFHAE
jgi:membrane fusion protein (multidrug efflux system)